MGDWFVFVAMSPHTTGRLCETKYTGKAGKVKATDYPAKVVRMDKIPRY